MSWKTRWVNKTQRGTPSVNWIHSDPVYEVFPLSVSARSRPCESCLRSGTFFTHAIKYMFCLIDTILCDMNEYIVSCVVGIWSWQANAQIRVANRNSASRSFLTRSTYVHALILSINWNFYFMDMYVCMYRGCPLWIAHWIGHSTGPGGGAHQKQVQCLNPAGMIGPASHMLVHTCTPCVPSAANFTLGS